MLYYATIDPATLELLKQIQSMEEFSGLCLAGGTALAIQTGHRKSIDLDFFGQIEFEQLAINELFACFNSVEVLKKTRNINIFEINDIKVDFVNYSYPWLQKPLIIDGLLLAQKEDIAAMKIAAITGRGSKKDFIDLYFLMQDYSLKQILDFYAKKYFDASIYLAIKSLIYFEDADQEENPEMLVDISWESIKTIIKSQVREYTS